MYPIYQNDDTNGQDGCELGLSIRLLDKNFRITSNEYYFVKFTHDSNPLKSTIRFIFDMHRDSNECKLAILEALSCSQERTEN